MMRLLIATIVPSLFVTICLMLATYYSLLFLLPMVFGMGDVAARVREYRKLCKCFDYRVVRKMRHSMCQRMAAIAASPDMKKTREMFRQDGYRWWHILPDGSFSLKDNCYLKKSFYLNLLGIEKK